MSSGFHVNQGSCGWLAFLGPQTTAIHTRIVLPDPRADASLPDTAVEGIASTPIFHGSLPVTKWSTQALIEMLAANARYFSEDAANGTRMFAISSLQGVPSGFVLKSRR